MRLAAVFLGDGGLGLVEVVPLGEVMHRGAALAFDQHLHGAVGELEQLKHGGDHADGVDVAGLRIVLVTVALGDEQDLLVALHHLFERLHRLLAPHEEGHDHVREHDDVAQRQNRQGDGCRHGTLTPNRRIEIRGRPLYGSTMNGGHQPRRCAELFRLSAKRGPRASRFMWMAAERVSSHAPHPEAPSV